VARVNDDAPAASPGPPLGEPRPIGREDVRRIRRRHRGYHLLLLAICTVLLIQPLARQVPLISPVMAILMALVMMLFLTRYSPLRARRRLFYGIGIAAIASEIGWLAILITDTPLAQHLAILHLLVWGLFIGTFLLRIAKALILEPYVTLAVLMGAAAGYLLIGYLGAFLLHTLLLWQPQAFNASLVAPDFDPRLHPLRVFPAMVVAAFQALTTTGVSLAKPGELLPATGCLAITVAGQLYLAVLIALVLGRFHRRQTF
jgi:hypothetical protein